MKIVATIEARMTSSRLPGKVMLLAAGKPMLEHLVNRLKQVNLIEEIVLATTVNAADDCLIDEARRLGIKSFRGSEDDVMERVIGAASSVSADIIVEITGDCPIIDPLLVEQTIQMFLNNDCDYASNAHVRSYPDGMDVQVYRLDTLKRSAAMTIDPIDHEHVTAHIIRHPELFHQTALVAPPDCFWPELGLTLDEQQDYQLLKHIIEDLGADNEYFSCRDAVNYMRCNPQLIELNAAVKRKGFT